MLTKSWNKGIDQAHSIHQCLFLLTWIGKKGVFRTEIGTLHVNL